jgi:hypothetical protein
MPNNSKPQRQYLMATPRKKTQAITHAFEALTALADCRSPLLAKRDQRGADCPGTVSVRQAAPHCASPANVTAIEG